MRFKQYINESNKTSFEKILQTINDKCQPFLKEWEQSFGPNVKGNKFFLSGRKNKKDYFIGTVRKNRVPVDMPLQSHKDLDDEFYNQFGIRARSNSIFTTGVYNTAKYYGDSVYAIFPINRYRYLWSPEIKDLFNYTNEGADLYLNIEDVIYRVYIKDSSAYENMNFKKYKKEKNQNPKIKEAIKKEKSDIKENITKIVSSYKDSDLKSAIQSNNEIMLNCRSYLAINFDIYGVYLDAFFEHGKLTDISQDSLMKWFKNNKQIAKTTSSTRKFINPDLDKLLGF